MKTFFGSKINSTSIFSDKGRRETVTLIKTEPLTVTQVKSQGKDGYWAVQVKVGKNKREIRENQEPTVKPGDQIKIADIFKAGDLAKISGLSKGRGFAGVMKRHGFHGVGGRTHGQSDRQRHPGSIGMRTTPGRLWKGKRMAGHYGVETVTVKNLKIINLDEVAGVVTVSGTVPGSGNSILTLTKL